MSFPIELEQSSKKDNIGNCKKEGKKRKEKRREKRKEESRLKESRKRNRT